MKAYKLTYDGGVVEYYPIENGKYGTYLDSSWNNTIVPISVEEIEVERLWIVNMRRMEWDESESMWITKQEGRVSPYRLTEQEANDDFHQLGCIDLREKKVVSSQSIIVPGCLWIKFMVQCQSINYLVPMDTI